MKNRWLKMTRQLKEITLLRFYCKRIMATKATPKTSAKPNPKPKGKGKGKSNPKRNFRGTEVKTDGGGNYTVVQLCMLDGVPHVLPVEGGQHRRVFAVSDFVNKNCPLKVRRQLSKLFERNGWRFKDEDEHSVKAPGVNPDGTPFTYYLYDGLHLEEAKALVDKEYPSYTLCTLATSDEEEEDEQKVAEPPIAAASAAASGPVPGTYAAAATPVTAAIPVDDDVATVDQMPMELQSMGNSLLNKLIVLGHSKMAPKITGMFLEMGIPYCENLLTNESVLTSEIDEAFKVLVEYRATQNALAFFA